MGRSALQHPVDPMSGQRDVREIHAAVLTHITVIIPFASHMSPSILSQVLAWSQEERSVWSAHRLMRSYRKGPVMGRRKKGKERCTKRKSGGIADGGFKTYNEQERPNHGKKDTAGHAGRIVDCRIRIRISACLD